MNAANGLETDRRLGDDRRTFVRNDGQTRRLVDQLREIDPDFYSAFIMERSQVMAELQAQLDGRGVVLVVAGEQGDRWQA